MGSFDDFKKVPSAKKVNNADSLIAYEKSYMDLLKRYKDEIQEIEMMMKNLRDERIVFYTERLPEIQKEMQIDEVSPEIRAQWLEKLQANMEKSFKISETLIEHYVTKNLDEFKSALQQAMGVV